MVDKKTLQSNSRHQIFNQNPNRISNSGISSIPNNNTTNPARLANPDPRSNNLSINVHDHSPTHRRNKQDRHQKPKRNDQNTRTTNTHPNNTTKPNRTPNHQIQKQQNTKQWDLKNRMLV